MIPFSPSADVAFVAEPDSAATLAALAGWPDLDTSIGVRSLNGKATKYVELLGRLAVQHGLDGQALRRAWRLRDCAEVKRLAHRLRGVGSTLGAVRVAAMAAALDLPNLNELAADEVDARVGLLDGALQALLRGLYERASIGDGASGSDPADD